MINVIKQIEKRMVRSIVRTALDLGYSISVNDGDSDVIVKSVKFGDIINHMMKKHEDFVVLYKNNTSAKYITLRYGKNGWDVVHDYSMSLSEWLEPIIKEEAPK